MPSENAATVTFGVFALTNVMQHKSVPSEASVLVSKRRKYTDIYTSFGFIECDNYPQCALCNKVLLNGSTVPVKLGRNLKKHADCKDKK